VFRAAGENETRQENIQDWLEPDEEDPEFQLPVFLQFLNNGSTVIFSLFIFISTTYIIKMFIYLFSKFFLCLLGISIASLLRSIA
jgi:hypothetical protein